MTQKSSKRQCAICSSNDFSVFFKQMYLIDKLFFDLIRCNECGIVFVDPLPSKRQREQMYSRDYFEGNKVSGMRERGYLEDRERYEREYSKIFSTLSRFKRPIGKLLDIGCAGGYFLDMARERGWSPEGIDISEWASSYARGHLGLPVYTGEIFDADLPLHSFDVIHAGNVLEHVEGPSAFVKRVYDLLKDDGIFVVGVPIYVNSFLFYTARSITKFLSFFQSKNKGAALTVLKLNKLKLDMPYHLYEFSPHLLKRLLEQAGFTVLHTHSYIEYPETIFNQMGVFYRILQFGFITLDFLSRVFNFKAIHLKAYCTKKTITHNF